jgi:hypothetical protein
VREVLILGGSRYVVGRCVVHSTGAWILDAKKFLHHRSRATNFVTDTFAVSGFVEQLVELILNFVCLSFVSRAERFGKSVDYLITHSSESEDSGGLLEFFLIHQSDGFDFLNFGVRYLHANTFHDYDN